jgi:hypothetical protein
MCRNIFDDDKKKKLHSDIHSLQIARLCKGARSKYLLFDQYNYGMDVIGRKRFSCFVFLYYLSFFCFLNKQTQSKTTTNDNDTNQFCGCWTIQWTTDADVENAISAIGVQDLVEVRFHENRANGQSKGFCVITVGSEISARQCMDKLPKKDLHGQTPIVTFTSKQALNQVRSKHFLIVWCCETNFFQVHTSRTIDCQN